jgi:phosphohistidine phosphatase
MQLLLFRHGIAEDHGPDGRDDSRRLTDKGVAKTTAAAAGLARIATAPEVIFTSPKVRARQTAAIVAARFDLDPQVADILGDNDAVAICHWLADLPHNRVLFVGHEPSFSQIVERLCTASGAAKASGGFVDMKKAGCACLDVDITSRTAVLQWLAPPKLLTKMG